MNRELLFSITKKDFTITWFSGTGAGGQHRNKHKNCCRMKHNETGIIGTGQSHRTQKANQKEAFQSVYTNPKFKLWLNKKITGIDKDEAELEAIVEQQMQPDKIKVEYF